MNYLVTGGAGFIGSNIVAELVRLGEKVRVLDNFSTGKKTNLEAFSSIVEVIEGDIRDIETVREAVSGLRRGAPSGSPAFRAPVDQGSHHE